MTKVSLIVLVAIFFLTACEKEKVSDIEPIIQLNTDDGFISSDYTMAAGQQYDVHVIASAENGENITNLIIKSNGTRIFDNGYNTPTLSEIVTLTKTSEETEILTFVIRNKARLSDSLSITLTKEIREPGEITRYTSNIMGCHENTALGNYYSLSNNLIYTQAEAFNNQNLIDFIYFYDAVEDENALGSPAANLSRIITGSDAPDKWTTKRTTRYTRAPINITNEEFENASNDSLILANLFIDGGRKAKHLTNDQFYGFVNEENKYGIIKIEDVTGQAEGTIQFSLIIQK